MKKLTPLSGRYIGAYFTCAIFILILTILVQKCTTVTWHVNDTKASGDTINVAIEISPMGLSMSGDTLSGFYYDMIREMAALHDRPLKIEGFTSLPEALNRLEKGRHDIIISDMAANKPLKERFLATHPVLLDRQVLVQLHDSTGLLRYPSQISLAHDTIYVPADSPFKTRLQHLTREIGDTIYIVDQPPLSAEQLIIMVAIGERPNTVVNRRLADILTRDYPQLDSSVEISFNQFQAWLLNSRDSILCDTINSWIDSYTNSDAMKLLQEKYFQ